MKIKIQLGLPSPDLFKRFRTDVSWGPLSLKQAQAALHGSLGGLIATADDDRNQGIGLALMTALIQHLAQTYPEDCRIGLFAAEDQDRFYERLGFTSRPEIGFGPGMHATLSELAKRSNAA